MNEKILYDMAIVFALAMAGAAYSFGATYTLRLTHLKLRKTYPANVAVSNWRAVATTYNAPALAMAFSASILWSGWGYSQNSTSFFATLLAVATILNSVFMWRQLWSRPVLESGAPTDETELPAMEKWYASLRITQHMSLVVFGACLYGMYKLGIDAGLDPKNWLGRD